MRLYAVEQKYTFANAGYYWAENENEAINEHRRQTGTDAELIASAVWANNKDMAYRGYITKEEREDIIKDIKNASVSLERLGGKFYKYQADKLKDAIESIKKGE